MWASKKMDNVRGEKSHSWTVEEVKATFEKMGFKKPETATQRLANLLSEDSESV